jgi:hypothetical protein
MGRLINAATIILDFLALTASRFLCMIGSHYWEYPGGKCLECGKSDRFFDDGSRPA